MTTALSAREALLLAEIASLKRSIRSRKGWNTRRKHAAEPKPAPVDKRHELLDDLAKINPEAHERVCRKLGQLA